MKYSENISSENIYVNTYIANESDTELQIPVEIDDHYEMDVLESDLMNM